MKADVVWENICSQHAKAEHRKEVRKMYGPKVGGLLLIILAILILAGALMVTVMTTATFNAILLGVLGTVVGVVGVSKLHGASCGT